MEKSSRRIQGRQNRNLQNFGIFQSRRIIQPRSHTLRTICLAKHKKLKSWAISLKCILSKYLTIQTSFSESLVLNQENVFLRQNAVLIGSLSIPWPPSSCRNPHRSAVAGIRNISGGRHPEGQIIWRPVPQDGTQDGTQDLFERTSKASISPL